MPIAKRDGFYASEDLMHVQAVGIESNRLRACVGHIRKNKIRGVFGHQVFGFAEDNLDFLRDIPFVEGVWFWEVSLKSIEALYELRHLKHFGVHPKRPAIDFSSFPEIESMVIEPRALDSGLGSLVNLKDLGLWRYRPVSGSFVGIGLPVNIEQLRIAWSSVQSLESMPVLENLKQLHIERCPKLEDLSTLSQFAPNLEHLNVHSCGRVSAENGRRSIEGMKSLRRAVIGTEVDVVRESATSFNSNGYGASL